jgi:ComF family protein
MEGDAAEIIENTAGKYFPSMRRAVARLFDIVFPRDCPVTGEPSDNPPWRYISAKGLAVLPRVAPPHCETCGFPFYGVLAGSQICPHCAQFSPVFSHGKTAVIAKGAARELVHTLKYRRGTWLAEDMARIIATTEFYPEFLDSAMLVPVPLHSARLRWRGHNQSLLIVRHLARILRDRHLQVADVLERTKNTLTQTLLDREERARNMQRAFALRAGVSIDVNARYVVFDDVFTTGSTLNACCSVLLDAGAKHVDVATFAHG